jgi:hypothetical protein
MSVMVRKRISFPITTLASEKNLVSYPLRGRFRNNTVQIRRSEHPQMRTELVKPTPHLRMLRSS